MLYEVITLSPVDLRGAPIRANPYPVYELAVAILGGVPTVITSYSIHYTKLYDAIFKRPGESWNTMRS